jgi:hypothetical protein
VVSGTFKTHLNERSVSKQRPLFTSRVDPLVAIDGRFNRSLCLLFCVGGDYRQTSVFIRLVEVMFADFELARNTIWLQVASQPRAINRQTSLKPVVVISCL